jgi:hypothetical protein
MKKLRQLATSICLIAPVIFSVPQSIANTPVSCRGVITSAMAYAPWFDVKGSRVTARNGLGFTAFTMANGFQIETYPLHTPASVGGNTFTLSPNSTYTQFTGIFTEVFTDRGNNDEDRWRMRLKNTGTLELQSITWGGAYKLLQTPVCYRGPGDQIVMTGHVDNPGFGSDFWSFVFVAGYFG